MHWKTPVLVSACYLGLLPCQYRGNPDFAPSNAGRATGSLDLSARKPRPEREAFPARRAWVGDAGPMAGRTTHIGSP